MGMSVGAGKKGGRRRRGVPRYGAMAEINMTPFIDVMLVLLIIFMVAAPMLTTGEEVNLPETESPPLSRSGNPDDLPIKVTVKRSGEILLMNNTVARADLIPALKTLAAGKSRLPAINFKGEKEEIYGNLMEVLAEVKAAGFKTVGLETTQRKD